MVNSSESVNRLFKESDRNNPQFWKHLGVSVDRINEYSDSVSATKYANILRSMSLNELDEFNQYFYPDSSEKSKKENTEESKDVKIQKVRDLSNNVQREILILKDFLGRKKRSVKNYYDSVSENFDTIHSYSQIIQLKQLLNDSLEHIIYLYTIHNWLNKGSGHLFSYDKKVNYKKIFQLPKDNAKHFSDELHKKSNKNNNYRIFSYASQNDDRVIVILYRQVNDASLPDFDEPIRNKEVASILFTVDINDKIIEIRSKFKSEVAWITEYFEENYGVKISEVKPDVFEEYSSLSVKSAFLEDAPPDDEEITDFIVNKVVFRSSPLTNSPSLTFSLENGDVLPAVKEAHTSDVIDLESIKDIHSVSFKSLNLSRTIKSSVLDKGKVLFSLNDSGIDSDKKKIIEEKFFKKFGLPLNKLISNAKFTAGKADVTDYLMTLSEKKAFDEIENELFSLMKQEEIVHESNEKRIICNSNDCDYTALYEESINECPECGYSEVISKEYNLIEISFENVRAYLKTLIVAFCQSSGWEIRNEPEKTFFSKKYKFINLVNDTSDDNFQILIQQGAIQNKFLEKINQSLTPTVIIFVGMLEKHLLKYKNNCIFPINFGEIYNAEEPIKLFSKLYEKIEQRSKAYLSSVANKSYERLVELPQPEEISISKDYSPGDFEDDVFNIIKDIFHNADKWGKNMTGTAVPEGIFTSNYNSSGPVESEHKYVYSYDCKLTKKNKGYDLSMGEQRKAFDYVEMLNQVDHVTRYSSIRQLSSHIFISNKFKENNYETMTDYFYRKLPEGYKTRPIFLPSEVLLHLHSEYRRNYDKINNSRNIFMKEMHKILVTDKMVIETADIDKVISKALDEETAEYKDMDTNKVKKGVTEILIERG